MPLRQTLLAFKAFSAPSDSATSKQRPELVRTPSTSSESNQSDTIVVERSEPQLPLPTPEESATDVSSQSSGTLSLKNVSHGRATRVGRLLKSRQSQEGLLEGTGSDKGRSVSGETLVTSSSQSSLVQSGIAALNLPWSMSSVFHDGSKADLLAQIEKRMSTDTLLTMNGEEEQARLEKVAARKAKMEENTKIREAKWKASDEKATRRSSRASMLEKAGGVVSDLANTVLGKRGRDAYERGLDKIGGLTSSLRPRSMLEPLSAATPTFEGPLTKKRRVSDGDLPAEPVTASRKSFARRVEKRWLTSGLYAGQSRVFDARLTESKNKRKQQSTKGEPEKENRVLPLPMFAGERLLKSGRDFKLPFDIFSPLPAGQPKPDEWRKTNKNVFVGDAADEWRVTTFQEHSTCMCKPETGCDSNCMNRFMYYECDTRNCNLTEEQCGNRAFEGLRQRTKKGGKYNIGVEVIKTADRGYGVRSNRTFEPNQIIVEYTGEIITQEECESRMRTIYKDNECYYLMAFDQNMIIDATRGSIARFVNHSCEPNCRMEKWTVGGKPRMALFAGERGIMTGEELTYDYNFDPYSQKNVQECRCGSRNCRGVLGPKPKEIKPKTEEEKSRSESKLAGAKRKIVDAIDEGLVTLTKKAKTMRKKNTSRNPSKVAVVKTKKRVMLGNSPRRRGVIRTKASASRGSSKLKQIINDVKRKPQSKRIVSTSSANDALIAKEVKKSLGRSASIRDSIRRNVVRTVQGARGGRARSIRPIADAE